MPIYEFKCLRCGGYFELLMMKKNDEEEFRCPHCESNEFERIVSSVNYSMGSSAGKSIGPSVQTRNCSGGSCTTWDIPGPR